VKGADAFHNHLDACAQCRDQPFNLCANGAALLAAVGPSSDGPLNVGDRVRFMGHAAGAVHGTVTNRYAGYVRIRFDDGIVGRFSHVRAGEELERVTGDDARPRHVWKRQVRDLAVAREREHAATLPPPTPAPPLPRELVDVYVCDACGVEQTDENELEACGGAPA
jgi:hypothetical protein